MDDYFDGRWLRKATITENFMEIVTDKIYASTWYELDLSSQEPLQEEQVKKTVTLMYRKIPNLGCCLGRKDGDLWLRRATNPHVDFKVSRDVKTSKIRDLLKEHEYNISEGPLFAARLLQDLPRDELDPEDIEPTFPHKSKMLFVFNHVTTDGTTNMNIMGFFITLLNDVIANKDINYEPLGVFLSDSETVKLFKEKEQILQKDVVLKDKIIKDYKFKKENLPLLVKHFSDPDQQEWTISYSETFDRETTTKFLKKCKVANTTVNAVITALANVAVVDTLLQNGVLQDSYVIQNYHCVNVRRYWHEKPFAALGMHVEVPLVFNTETAKNTEDKFWDYAKALNDVMKHDVESGRILFNRAFELYMSPQTPCSKDQYPSSKRYESDYITSNMGDITPLVTIGGDHVRVTRLIRGTTIDRLIDSSAFNFHTFRGRFMLMYEYNTRAIKESVAKTVFSQMIKHFYEIVN